MLTGHLHLTRSDILSHVPLVLGRDGSHTEPSMSITVRHRREKCSLLALVIPPIQTQWAFMHTVQVSHCTSVIPDGMCITATCGPTVNSTHVCIIIPRYKHNSPINVDYCAWFIPHWHSHFTPCHVQDYNSQPSHGRNMTLHTKLSEV